jgi:PAS domain-containing protein
MIGAGLDITDLKEVEREINEKNQHLAQAWEELKNAEEYLVKVNNELELRVQERTAELQASQEELLQTLDQTLELNLKLSESENFLSSIIAQSPVSTWIADAEGTQIRVNKACLELFGVEDETLSIGKYNILKDNLLQNEPYFKDIQAVFTKGPLPGLAAFIT